MTNKSRVDDLIARYYRNEFIGQRALEHVIQGEFAAGRTRALDAGCGVDAPLTRKFCEQGLVVGVDLSRQLPKDLAVICGDLAKLPFRDGAFSLIFSRSVFEHLPQPDLVLEEFYRVLQPNGACIILTPNGFDYTSVVARFTPQWFHRWFVRKLYASAAYDTFPTFYRANTPGYFKSFVSRNGGWRIRRLSGLRHYPANLAFSRLLFRLGILYDWAIASAGISFLQPSLLVVLKKNVS
jgi:SAM-dependent methyltransferase